MSLRLTISFLALFCLAGCGAFAAEISHEMAPVISTEVALQVGTALAEAPPKSRSRSPRLWKQRSRSTTAK